MPTVSAFDSKAYNPQAFGRYINSIPKVRKNEMIKANIFTSDKNLKALFNTQSTAVYAVQPLVGEFKANVQDLDGSTDITGGTLNTYYYGVTSYIKSIAGTEKDYTKDIIPGLNALDHIANKFSAKWDDVDEDTLVSIIKGIFASTTDGLDEFATKHTLTVDSVSEDSIYDATQKACGDHADIFSLCIMHSKIANELAKKQLLQYIKYTDERGIERNTRIAQWGAITVLVDDTTTTTSDHKYVTYILGEKLFDREDLDVEEPFERVREGLKNGGQTTLVSRQMKVLHPMGFSYLKASQAKITPTDSDFANGSNWGLAKTTDALNPEYYPEKAIPLARIISTESGGSI